MKKRSITRKQMWKQTQGPLTMGLDLGDRHSQLCVLDSEAKVVWSERVSTTRRSLTKLFDEAPPSRVVMEVGTHSPWISRLAAAPGHEVVVANARNVSYITRSSRKSDKVDAESLARLGRTDPKLLSPIRHRSEQAQGDLAVIRARAAVVEMRTKAVNAARGLAKSMGERLAKCDADRVGPHLVAGHSELLQRALSGLL
ncbi:MAG: IS110 family transposase, partial [Colwellia sp.]|nr:IS110 family transposase [Colwellia sp.]